jgi:hypothetical protein
MELEWNLVMNLNRALSLVTVVTPFLPACGVTPVTNRTKEE